MTKTLHLSRNIVIVDDNGSVTLDFGGAKFRNISNDDSPESFIKKQCMDELKSDVSILENKLILNGNKVNELSDKIDKILETQNNVSIMLDKLNAFRTDISNKYSELTNIMILLRDEQAKNSEIKTKMDLMFTHLNNITDEVNVTNSNVNKILYYFFNSFDVPDYRNPPQKDDNNNKK
jgi:hypothetical protein